MLEALNYCRENHDTTEYLSRMVEGTAQYLFCYKTLLHLIKRSLPDEIQSNQSGKV